MAELVGSSNAVVLFVVFLILYNLKMETEEDTTEIKTKPSLENQGVDFLQQTGEFKITCQNGFTYHQHRKYKDVNIEAVFLYLHQDLLQNTSL